jgi:hypothetical protein
VELAPTAVDVGVRPAAHVREAEEQWQRAVGAYRRGDVYARLEVFADVKVIDEVVRVEQSEGGFWVRSEEELPRLAADAAFDALPMLLDDLLGDVLVEELDEAEIDRLLADSQRREIFEHPSFEFEAAEDQIRALRAPLQLRSEPRRPSP